MLSQLRCESHHFNNGSYCLKAHLCSSCLSVRPECYHSIYTILPLCPAPNVLRRLFDFVCRGALDRKHHIDDCNFAPSCRDVLRNFLPFLNVCRVTDHRLATGFQWYCCLGTHLQALKIYNVHKMKAGHAWTDLSVSILLSFHFRVCKCKPKRGRTTETHGGSRESESARCCNGYLCCLCPGHCDKQTNPITFDVIILLMPAVCSALPSRGSTV